MKILASSLLCIGITLGVFAATRWDESRLRLHLTGTLAGRNWLADLVLSPGVAKLQARLFEGTEIHLDGRLLDTTISFSSTNTSILPGTVTADIPSLGSTTLNAVWAWRSQRQAFPARVLARENRRQDLKENLHDASCAWPEFIGYNAYANTTITSTLSNFAVSNHMMFLQNSVDPAERNDATMLWAHHLGYDLYAATDRFVSVRFALYTYTGGAHPGRWTRSWNFAISGESSRELHLASIIRSTQIESLVSLIQKKLNDLGASWPLEVNRVHLENFCITPTGMNFHFDPYIAGCYAEGDYEVFLTWQELERFTLPGVM